jgi:cytochrome c oxidase subunit 4
MTATEHAGPAGDVEHAEHAADHAHEHPSDGQYVLIALILAAITALEVGTYYLDFFKKNFVALLFALIPMMIVKFAMVAAFFMHLKFDNKLFRRVFITGILLATFVYMIVLFSFHVFSH